MLGGVFQALVLQVDQVSPDVVGVICCRDITPMDCKKSKNAPMVSVVFHRFLAYNGRLLSKAGRSPSPPQVENTREVQTA